MKKIMQFIHGMYMGGAETLVKDYLLSFNQNKYELVLLVLERYNSPYEKILKDNNIRIICVEDKLKKNKGIYNKIYNHFMRYIIVKNIIHQEKPDILHYHLPIDSYIKYSRPNKNTKIFSTIHSEPRRLYNKTRTRKKEMKAAKWLINNYDFRFLCLQDDMKNEINEMFEVNNSIVVNNGIDMERFRNAKSRSEIRKELNIPKNALVIGHVGRFHHIKNHKYLVDIFNEIYKKNNNAFLLMIGDGSERNIIEDKLRKLNLKNNYLILESRTDIPDLMNSMDYFVFPSIVEGLGIVLIEAQEMRLPCFKSTNVPDYSIISNLVTSISLNEGPNKWASKILNYERPKSIVVNDKEWDIKNVVKKLEKIYEEKI